MQRFEGFIDRKHRKAIKELGILDEIFRLGGLKVKKFFEDKIDPYIFVYSPVETPFLGVRVYKIEHSVAYRVQNDEKTAPYGHAQSLNVEKIFEDYLEDDDTGEKVGSMVAKAIVDDISFFFKKNAELYKPMASMTSISTPPTTNSDNFKFNGPSY